MVEVSAVAGAAHAEPGNDISSDQSGVRACVRLRPSPADVARVWELSARALPRDYLPLVRWVENAARAGEIDAERATSELLGGLLLRGYGSQVVRAAIPYLHASGLPEAADRLIRVWQAVQPCEARSSWRPRPKLPELNSAVAAGLCALVVHRDESAVRRLQDVAEVHASTPQRIPVATCLHLLLDERTLPQQRMILMRLILVGVGRDAERLKEGLMAAGVDEGVLPTPVAELMRSLLENDATPAECVADLVAVCLDSEFRESVGLFLMGRALGRLAVEETLRADFEHALATLGLHEACAFYSGMLCGKLASPDAAVRFMTDLPQVLCTVKTEGQEFESELTRACRDFLRSELCMRTIVGNVELLVEQHLPHVPVYLDKLAELPGWSNPSQWGVLGQRLELSRLKEMVLACASYHEVELLLRTLGIGESPQSTLAVGQALAPTLWRACLLHGRTMVRDLYRFLREQPRGGVVAGFVNQVAEREVTQLRRTPELVQAPDALIGLLDEHVLDRVDVDRTLLCLGAFAAGGGISSLHGSVLGAALEHIAPGMVERARQQIPFVLGDTGVEGNSLEPISLRRQIDARRVSRRARILLGRFLQSLKPVCLPSDIPQGIELTRNLLATAPPESELTESSTVDEAQRHLEYVLR